MDTVPPEKRSTMMRAVRGKHTRPERVVRSAAHALGLRFRLHRRDLPGRPDLVFPRHRTVVFVNGCFWHRHADCSKASTPRTNRAFWREKFLQNVRRDERNVNELQARGWRVVVLWECQIRSIDDAKRQLRDSFGPILR